jgi:hypothetical protein
VELRPNCIILEREEMSIASLWHSRYSTGLVSDHSLLRSSYEGNTEKVYSAVFSMRSAVLLQRIGTNVRLRGFNAGLLARSQLHSEGPATGKLDQGFPWFSLVPEQILSCYSNSTLHCMLPMQPSQW